jgi:hypothetical protein
MEFDHKNELFTEIHEALRASVRPSTTDELTFVHEVAVLAAEAASKHVQELLEANGHLQETIKRLSKES